MKTGRSRKMIPAFCDAAQGQTINLNWPAIFNCTLLQFSITYSATPHANDVMIVKKISANDTRIAPTFRTIDMGSNGWINQICNEYFELMKGDQFIVTAGNGNDLDVGFEAIFEEGG